MTKKVLFLNTSATHFGKSKELPTGIWLEELAAPYRVFKDAGYEISFASPSGGPIPIDAKCLSAPFFTDESKEFLYDAEAMDMFSHSKKIADVSTGGDYDVLFLPGGHGACGDFVDNVDVKTAIENTYNAGKFVAAVCHGPIALAECFKADGKTPLVNGLKVTGFSNSEEEAVGLTEEVPFLLETRFKEQGAIFEKSETDWSSHVVADGNLITGQNPASSKALAEKVVELLA